MEGPSLIIAVEELKPFLKKKITGVSGTVKLDLKPLNGATFLKARSWGKHLILHFTPYHLRIHFLMFGSYRINHPRENRIPKLTLEFGRDRIYFYSCAIRILTPAEEKAYDWSADLMGPKWDAAKALTRVRAKPRTEVADLLMDQSIFSGLGNIMKNETLFDLRMHPQTLAGELTPARQRKLVREAEAYAWKFYEWKKLNQLKRNWKIMRKKTCPVCEGKVTKRETGKLKRISHYCGHCQKRE